MTATALSTNDDAPLRAELDSNVVEQLDEETLTALLLARFRSFVAHGRHATDALLAAVDHPLAEPGDDDRKDARHAAA